MENSQDNSQDNPQFNPIVVELSNEKALKANNNKSYSREDVISARLEYNHSKNYKLCRMSDRVVRKDIETGMIFKGSLSKAQFFAIVKIHNSQYEENLDPQEVYDNLEEIQEVERD